MDAQERSQNPSTTSIANVMSTPKKNAEMPSDIEGSPLTVLSSVATPSPLKRPAPQASATSTNGTSHTPSSAPSDNAPPAKRRRFTEQEKEEQRREKEAKDKARAEKKAAKEEEVRLKEEEKRKKKEEREEKKRAKEIEQLAKDEEKRKKERGQTRLNAFFAKPKPDEDKSKATAVDTLRSTVPDTALLAVDATMQDTNQISPSPQKALKQAAKSDYERYFLPFQLPSHAIMAPFNRYLGDPARLNAAQSRLEALLSNADKNNEAITMESLRMRFQTRGRRGHRGPALPSIADIVERYNSSSDHPIDLTTDGRGPQDPLALLRQIPMKYLHFPEDVRPPYYGTYTKPHTWSAERKLARNPFARRLDDLNYDYDSEAEWDEPEEGEDLDSDGEEDLDEEGEDGLDGFLDDDDDPQVKRRLISGDLQPVSTGLCWEDARGFSILNDGSGAISTEFKGFRMGILLGKWSRVCAKTVLTATDPQPQTIDPFSTAYWAPEPTSAPKAAVGASKGSTTGSTMQPPRMPLTPMSSMMNSINASAKTGADINGKPGKPPKRFVPDDQLADFKAEIQGKKLTKIAMVEALKQRFPKLPKDAINNTLTREAARVGPKEVDKIWVLRPERCST
ncbi:hypothetical protein M011DRAFT_496853 [Sporormia fimetaria CBS 119925]|uniref:Chromatin assembly factor 1 subunit A n=1 Tax=Sporormia fimetaria CBS 119925 TaxID=1340428 RepID=A0A6A6V172_9PLEO|nr:hypothetical protein M011DRAFT_496853 [Sporormia fimetaria CBS 119925]